MCGSQRRFRSGQAGVNTEIEYDHYDREADDGGRGDRVRRSEKVECAHSAKADALMVAELGPANGGLPNWSTEGPQRRRICDLQKAPQLRAQRMCFLADLQACDISAYHAVEYQRSKSCREERERTVGLGEDGEFRADGVVAGVLGDRVRRSESSNVPIESTLTRRCVRTWSPPTSRADGGLKCMDIRDFLAPTSQKYLFSGSAQCLMRDLHSALRNRRIARAHIRRSSSERNLDGFRG
ncbi:hypothetical protein FB451DRAFT_1178978 [Mycena latifolia]|nr:hypothetical protein FB451DRAFT_1178978 [Mycena latifolia]